MGARGTSTLTSGYVFARAATSSKMRAAVHAYAPSRTVWLTSPDSPVLVIQITNPMGQYEIFQKDSSNGDYTFDAKHDGKYVYCFGNEHWGASSKEVSFNVHGVVYVSEHDADKDPLETEGMAISVTLLSARSPSAICQRSPANIQGPHFHLVRHLSDLVAQVKDEQGYIVVRERTHRNTAESTNARVKWWNMFVILVVVGDFVFQVWWLRRFFEVKRVV